MPPIVPVHGDFEDWFAAGLGDVHAALGERVSGEGGADAAAHERREWGAMRGTLERAGEPNGGAEGAEGADSGDAVTGTKPAPTEDGPKESPEAPIDREPTPEPPPTPEAAAARFAAMGPMSHAAVELLTRHDVRGVDVDVPALLRAGDEGGAVGLLADPATARWFSRYLVRDLHAMVKV